MSVQPRLSAKQEKISPYFATFSKQLETAKARLPIPKSSEIDEILNTELAKAFNGKADVKGALTAAATKIDKLLGA